MNRPMICDLCAQRGTEAGFCSCGGERFDLQDERVRMMLIESDDDRRERRDKALKWLALPSGPVVISAALVVMPAARIDDFGPRVPFYGFAIMMLISVSVWRLMRLVFGAKPKFGFVVGLIAQEVARDRAAARSE